jgi:hypothetical protein
MVTGMAAEVGDVTVDVPVPNRCTAETDHVPSTMLGNSQLPSAAVAVKVQVTGSDPAWIAVTVTAAPGVRFETSINGVWSLVIESLSDRPESELPAKLTTGVSMIRQLSVVIPTFPALSVAMISNICGPGVKSRKTVFARGHATTTPLSLQIAVSPDGILTAAITADVCVVTPSLAIRALVTAEVPA